MTGRDDCGRTPNGILLPVDAYPDYVQDLGDVLYDLPEQHKHERYVDYAARIVEGLQEKGWRVAPAPTEGPTDG